MNENATNFIGEVLKYCAYPKLSLTESLDVLVLSDNDSRLIIDGNDIEKYYTGYVMSAHQTRLDALNRAANYIDKIANEWNNKNKRQSKK